MTREQMIQIMQYQLDISNAGWQWEEHIFNDGSSRNCMVSLTKNTDPTYFTKRPLGDIGWGRFERYTAWYKAHEAIIVNKEFE